MTKQEKIESLDKAMTTSKRSGEETAFHHFTDTAPKELIDLFLEHYDVNDLDYKVFSTACDLVHDMYFDQPEASGDDAEQAIYERANDIASVYTADRLAYLNVQNEYEISQMMKEYDMGIADVCAAWYDRQVEQAAIIINGWVNT